MILFGVGAAALLAVVVGMLLPTLLNPKPLKGDDRDRNRENIRIARRRLAELDDCGDAAARAEIEFALLDDLAADNPSKARAAKTPGKFRTALILAALPIFSIGLYLQLGNPAALAPHAGLLGDSGETPSLQVLMQELEQKLAANPANADGWALAGSAYLRLGQFAKAERAYRTLHQLTGDDANVLTAWADAEVRANDGVFSPETLTRLERALALAPTHQGALLLAALGAEYQGDHRQALGYLARLAQAREGGEQADGEAERLAARMRRVAQAAQLEISREPESESAALRVAVKIDPQLAGWIRPDQRVYVFAKAVDGPPMPIRLAVSSHLASDLPVLFTLDDSTAMVDGKILSDFDLVSVMARLSRSDNPIAQPGDMESASENIAVSAQRGDERPLELVIDRLVGARHSGR